MSKLRSIAIGGYPGSGKTSVAQAIEHRGFNLFSGSKILQEEATKTGYVSDGSRDGFVEFWKQVADVEGRGWLSNRVLEQADGRPFVFDGLRIREDADNFIDRNTLIVFIEFNPVHALKKLKARKRSDDSGISTFEGLQERLIVEDNGEPFNQSYVRSISEVVLPSIPYVDDEPYRYLLLNSAVDIILDSGSS